MNEFELKFEIPAQSLPQIVAAMHAESAQLQMLQACYFDTKEGTLASSGLVLRLRKEGTDWVQTAKAMTSSPLERLEHNVKIQSPKSTVSNKALPSIDLSRHAHEKIGKLIMDALKIKPDALFPALIAVYETDVQRLNYTVKHAGSIIEIALDQGMVVSGGRSATLCELEIELKQGKPEHAIALARTWCATYGLWISTITKSMKGQRLQDNLLSSQLKHEALEDKPELKSNANGQQIVLAVFQSCLNPILANASEIASGSEQAHHIHQLRVGIRRLRTAMRELKTLAVNIDPAWEIPLIDAFRALGQHRDDDYFTHNLQPQILTAGGLNINMHREDSHIAEPSRVIRAPLFQDTLLCLIGFVHGVNLNGVNLNGSHLNDSQIDVGADVQRDKKSSIKNQNHKQAKKIMTKRLNKLYEPMIKLSDKFVALNETQQHTVRKQFKRLRYLAEFSSSIFATSSSTNSNIQFFIAGLKPVQDALGLYNDELMALQTYRKLTVKDKRAWFGVGWLSARRKPNAKVCQHEIRHFIKKCTKKKPFWQ